MVQNLVAFEEPGFEDKKKMPHAKKSVVRQQVEAAIDEKITPQFNTVNQRFDTVDQRFDKVDQDISAMKQSLTDIQNSLNTLKPKP